MISKKQRLAELVKEKRREKSYSQAKLAELTGLSLRSIQRIEKAEVYPRDYSIKAITEVLHIPNAALDERLNNSKKLLPRKLIFSISSGLFVPLIGLAFIAQSPTFPETHFEMILFLIFILLIIATIQWIIWDSPLMSKKENLL